jgi:hypothetical protein
VRLSALNEANSQKIASSADAERVQKETRAIMAGQLTNTAGGTQNRAQKKQPGDNQEEVSLVLG